MPDNHALYRAGDTVRTADRDCLERFRQQWKYHNKLTPEQVSFAAVTARVKLVMYYHGGTPLYELEGVPGVWHEECLGAPKS